MIKIGGRVSFDTIDSLESNFKNINFPIELALPWKYTELWKPATNKIREIIDFFTSSQLPILSIHATQGRISENDFLNWGKQTILIADALNVHHITIHPENRKTNRENYTLLAGKHIRMVEREMGKEGIFSIETFAGYRRIFRINEIMAFTLPMTLDTAHIHDHYTIIEIIKNYHHYIPTVHLSAKGETEHHIPIDKECITIVKLLKDKQWKGNIIIEYLPWHHYRVAADILALNRFIYHDEPITIIPPDDKYRDRPECWGFHPAG